MFNILRRTLRVEGKELSVLSWLFLFGSFLGVAVSTYDLASVSNFLESYNHSYLPGAIICSGLLGIFVANTFISIQNWISYTKVASLTLLSCFVFSIAAFLFHDWFSSGVFVYISFVLTGPITTLSLLVFWGLFERLFDLAQGRRLSTKAEAGMVLAIVITLGFIALTNDPFYKSVSHIYSISFYSLVFSLITLFAVSYKYSFLRKVIINVQYIKAYNNYKKILRLPYIILLASFSLLSAVAFYITDYTFLVFVDQFYTGFENTLDFLASFSAAVIGVSFLLQIFIVRWLNDKYGYQVSLLVLPVLLGLFTSIYAVLGAVEGYEKENTVFFFLFMLVCISKLFSLSLFRSVEFSTFKFFFMPLDNLLRFDLQSKIERVVREAGKVIAGIFIAIVVYNLNFEYLPFVLMGFIALWVFSCVKVNRAYRDKLKLTLDEPEEIEKKERVFSNVILELKNAIASSEGNELEVQLSLLKILDPVAYKDSIVILLESENEKSQEISLLETSRLCLLPAIPVLERIQKSKYYPVLKTRDLIDKVHTQLKAAEFRLEKLKYIEQLTLSKLRRERVFGALLAAYSEDSMKPRLLNKLFRDSDVKVRYNAVVSSAGATGIDLQKNQIEKLGESYYGNAAISAITSTGENVFPAMENAFYLTGQEEKVQLRIVQAYGRIGSEAAVQLLLKKLNYTNQNVNRAAFEAVSGCGYNIGGERVLQFKTELEEYVNVLVWNISAYLDLHINKSSEVILLAMISEIESNYNSIFKLLTLLYDPKTIVLIKENIFSKDPEKSEYAFGLLEVTLADGIKSFLLPMFSNSSFEDKLEKIQDYFPSKAMPKVEILYDLVQRDYKYVNRWTKACALKELAEEKGAIDPEIFIANVINPDSLLKETAAVALYIKAPDLFTSTFERFQRELGTAFSKDLVNKILIPNKNSDRPLFIDVEGNELPVIEEKVNNSIINTSDYFTAPDLRFEIIKFLNGVPEFKDVPGIVLLELARITEFYKFNESQVIASYDSFEDLDYYLVRTGKVVLTNGGDMLATYLPGAFIHNYYLNNLSHEEVKLLAQNDCQVYRIKQDEFNEAMSFFDEIAWSMIRNIKKEVEKTPKTELA